MGSRWKQGWRFSEEGRRRRKQKRRGGWREEVTDDDTTDSGLPVVRVDPAVLMRGGLHDTPAGWRAAVEELGLGGLPLRGAAASLQAVVRGRPDTAWRRQRWLWVLAGGLPTLLAGVATAVAGQDGAMALVLAVQFLPLSCFLGFMVGRIRYDRRRARAARGRDGALAAVDALVSDKWRDVLKLLAVEPVARRGTHALVDGTEPARQALRTWGAWVQVQRRSLPTLVDEAREGLQVMSELGSLGGVQGGLAAHELEQIVARGQALQGRLDDLKQQIRRAGRDLDEALRTVGAGPVGEEKVVTLRPLFEELDAVHTESAALAEAFSARVGTR